MCRKSRNLISLIVFTYFVAGLFNGITISAQSKSPSIPTPVVSGLKSTYEIGETAKIILTSSGTSAMVQYSVILTNVTTGRTIDLIKGYTKKYYNSKYMYTLSVKLDEPGEYSLTVCSKIAGYKDKYSRNIKLKFVVTPEDLEIDKVNPIVANVMAGNSFSLPQTIDAIMKDGSRRRALPSYPFTAP